MVTAMVTLLLEEMYHSSLPPAPDPPVVSSPLRGRIELASGMASVV